MTKSRSIPALGLHGGDLFRAIGGVEGVDRLSPQAPRWQAAVRPRAGDPRRCPDALGGIPRRRRSTRPRQPATRVVAWPAPRVDERRVPGGVGRRAPRGRPNDGRVDVVSVTPDMGVGDRWKARRRLVLGPACHIQRSRSGRCARASGRWRRERRLHVDGVGVRRACWRSRWSPTPSPSTSERSTVGSCHSRRSPWTPGSSTSHRGPTGGEPSSCQSSATTTSGSAWWRPH